MPKITGVAHLCHRVLAIVGICRLDHLVARMARTILNTNVMTFGIQLKKVAVVITTNNARRLYDHFFASFLGSRSPLAGSPAAGLAFSLRNHISDQTPAEIPMSTTMAVLARGAKPKPVLFNDLTGSDVKAVSISRRSSQVKISASQNFRKVVVEPEKMPIRRCELHK